jgi:hypothetical protein
MLLCLYQLKYLQGSVRHKLFPELRIVDPLFLVWSVGEKKFLSIFKFDELWRALCHVPSSTGLSSRLHVLTVIMTGRPITVHAKISLSSVLRQRGSDQCERHQIGFQKFNNPLQYSQGWAGFQCMTRAWHTRHLMSLVCYNYWHQQDSA